MHCPKCETKIQGRRCVCGYQVPGASRSSAEPRWKTCEWIHRGLQCQVPTGRLWTEGSVGRLRPPRLCGYHQERSRWSLAGTYQSEEDVFYAWAAKFEPGTTYQPYPRIWDGETGPLWQMVSGQLTWPDFLQLVPTRAAVPDRKAAPAAGLSMEEALCDRPDLLDRLKRMGVGR